MENELGCYRLGNSGKMKLIIKLSIWEINLLVMFSSTMWWNLKILLIESLLIQPTLNRVLIVLTVVLIFIIQCGGYKKISCHWGVISRKALIRLLYFSVTIRLDQDAWKLTATISFTVMELFICLLYFQILGILLLWGSIWNIIIRILDWTYHFLYSWLLCLGYINLLGFRMKM